MGSGSLLEGADWPDREAVFPGSSAADDGIDAVGVRRSDDGLVAIQCKARKLDETGTGNPIGKDELDSFGFATAGDEWEERWLITNGNAPPSAPATRTVALSGKTIKVVNITADLEAQAAASATDGDCPHCAADAGPGAVRSKSCMQDEALSESVATLRAHADSTTGGSLKGRARGKIVLPCGTGKTRISLRIVEELCDAGDTAVVPCPSIALVAQLRREYLIHAGQPIRSLSVCSDQTAGHLAEGGAEALPGLGGSKGRVSKPAEEHHLDALKDDPTLDLSHVSASEIKGQVTTDPTRITDWIASATTTRGWRPFTASTRLPRLGSMAGRPAPPAAGTAGLCETWTTKRRSVSSCTAAHIPRPSATAGWPTIGSSLWASTTRPCSLWRTSSPVDSRRPRRRCPPPSSPRGWCWRWFSAERPVPKPKSSESGLRSSSRASRS